MTVTDAMLMAYVDGELSPDDGARIDAAAAADPALAARLARHRLLAGGLRGAFAEVADEPVPERLTALLDGGKVVNLDAARARRMTPAWGRWGTLAAGVAAGVIVGLTVPRGPAPMVGTDMRAHGQLASALDSQLASAPARGALVRVGLSFRARDNRYCRTFTVTSAPLAGADASWLSSAEASSPCARMSVPTIGAGPRGTVSPTMTPAATPAAIVPHRPQAGVVRRARAASRLTTLPPSRSAVSRSGTGSSATSAKAPRRPPASRR